MAGGARRSVAICDDSGADGAVGAGDARRVHGRPCDGASPRLWITPARRGGAWHCDGMPRPDLPHELGDHFSVTEARASGVSRSRLRARDLERTFHGARSRAEQADATSPSDPETAYPPTPEALRMLTLARQYAAVMPVDAYFSHVAAAVIWGAPLPSRLLKSPKGQDDHDRADPPLDVSVPWPARSPRGRGVLGHAIRPTMGTAVVHPGTGLRVSDPATTWTTLGGGMPHPYDLVAVADFFVRVRRPPFHRPSDAVAPPLATTDDLAKVIEAGRRRHAPRLRDALARVRTGSASRTETWTRLTLVDAGLPEPVLDFDVFDDAGAWLARVDMAYPQWRIAIEYEGIHHSSGEQWERDVDRYARLEAAGWKVIRVTKQTLFTSPRMIEQRVRAAIAASGR